MEKREAGLGICIEIIMPKVINIPASQAEEIQQLLPNECLISIGEEHGGFWDLKVDGDRVLKIRFADVNADTFHKDVFLHAMNTDQAHEIIDFIEKWNGNDFLVNCFAGCNRSASVAIFLHLCYGYELKPYFYKMSEGNSFVLGLLIKEYLKLKNGVYGDDWKFSF